MNINITEPEGINPVQDAIDHGDGFEGDIHLNSEQKDIISNSNNDGRNVVDELRAASTKSHHKWPKSGCTVIVPYVIHNRFNSFERAVIANAFTEFHSKTCIR